jgi:Asp-tRNA(Asn)/Glu-tRNA(Gln) amidotransferase B subunit
MKEWMELVEYRITEGSDYGWQCYGSNAYMLDSWNGDHDGHSFTIIFDTKDQTVYEVQAHDYVHNRAYRMINEDFAKKHRKESKHRDVSKDNAWDDVDYVDLEVDDDFFQKCLAIRAREDYSTDISVPLDLPDELILQAALNAHKQNITLNEYINQTLVKMIEQVKSGEITKKDADEFVEEHYN